MNAKMSFALLVLLSTAAVSQASEFDLRPYLEMLESVKDRKTSDPGTADLHVHGEDIATEEVGFVLDHILANEIQKADPLAFQIAAGREPGGVKVVLVAQHTAGSVDFFLVRLFERGRVEPIWGRYDYVCSYYPCGGYFLRILQEEGKASSFLIGSEYMGMMDIAIRDLEGNLAQLPGIPFRAEIGEDPEKTALLVWVRNDSPSRPCADDDSKRCRSRELKVIAFDPDARELYSSSVVIGQRGGTPKDKIEALRKVTENWFSSWPGAQRTHAGR